MADILCYGDLLVDFVPQASGLPLDEVETFTRAPGGAAANVAVGLARLGVASAFMGKVGDDAFGHWLAGVLAHEGVETGAIRFDARARTALAFVSLMADGERDFLFYRHPSADMLFGRDEVDRAAIGAASIFHFDSISLASAEPRGTALFAADLASDAGTPVSYDVNMRLPLWADAAAAREGILGGLKRARILKLSDDELDFLTGSREIAALRGALWHDGLALAVLTRGRAGSVLLTADGEREVASPAVEAVDATGAGDAFVAGLLAAIAGDPALLGDTDGLAAAVRFANAAGALATTRRGAIPALPTRAEVEKVLRDAGAGPG